MWMNVLWASTIVTQTPAAPTLTVPLLVHVMADISEMELFVNVKVFRLKTTCDIFPFQP